MSGGVPASCLPTDIESQVHTLLSEALNYDDRDMPLEAYKKYCESMNALMAIIKETPGGGNRRLSGQSVKIAQKCISRMSELVDKLDHFDSNEADIRRRLSQLSPLYSAPNLVTDELNAPKIDEEASKEPSRTTTPPVEERKKSTELSSSSLLRNMPVSGRATATTSDNMALNLRKARKHYETTQLKNIDPVKTELILSNIIMKRQKFSSNIMALTDWVTSKVKDVQQIYKERAEEELWRDRLGKDLLREESYVLDSVMSLLATKGTPINDLTMDFLARQRVLIHNSRPVQVAVDEVHLFCFHLIDFLKFKSPTVINHPDHELSLKLTIQQFLFTTPLGAHYMMALRKVHADDDLLHLSKCCELGWTDVWVQLKLKEKFKATNEHFKESILRDGEGYLSEVLQELRSMSAKPTPFLKLSCVASAMSRIVAEISKRLPEAEVGSEDLLLLLSFCLIRAQIPDLHSQLEFISDLIPEEILRGESGYVLATLQTCMMYIDNMTVYWMESNRRDDGLSKAVIHDTEVRQPKKPAVAGHFYHDSFDRLSDEDVVRLEALYTEREGKAPSRRETKMYSDALGIPQCKIKRWFSSKDKNFAGQALKSSSPELSEAGCFRTIIPRPFSDPEVSGLLAELHEQVRILVEVNDQVGDFLKGMK